MDLGDINQPPGFQSIGSSAALKDVNPARDKGRIRW